jgi:hypothetical protein
MAEFTSYLSYQKFSESVRTRWRYASDPEQGAFLKVSLRPAFLDRKASHVAPIFGALRLDTIGIPPVTYRERSSQLLSVLNG